MAELNFKRSEVPKETVIPKGEYRLVISGVEVKTSQAGHDRLNLRFTVLGGQYANRSFFEGYNSCHPNPETRGIAMRQLAAIFDAIGAKGDVTLKSQILNGSGGQVSVPFSAYVDIKDGGSDFGLQNVLKKPKAISGTTMPTPPPPVNTLANEAASPVAAAESAPWATA